VIEETGSTSSIQTRPLPEDDPKVRQPDITLARELLEWEPRIGLREGLKKTVPYFRELVEGEGAEARTLGPAQV
jgi:nucleoside-diphosphate-sugar epimerase